MADHSKPTITSTYSNFVTELDARFDDLAVGLDPAIVTVTNIPTNSIRWSSASNKWQKWNGSSWGDLSSNYDIAVKFTPTGGIASTTVQSAIAELDSEKQPIDAGLTSIAALSTSADRMIYTTAADTYATTTLTSQARTFLSAVDVAAQRNVLGLNNHQLVMVDAGGNVSTAGSVEAGPYHYLTGASTSTIGRTAVGSNSWYSGTKSGIVGGVEQGFWQYVYGGNSWGVYTNGLYRASINGAGRFLLNTTTDDGINQFQCNGSAKITNGVLYGSGWVAGKSSSIPTPGAGNYWVCIGAFNYLHDAKVSLLIASQNHEEIITVESKASYYTDKALLNVKRQSNSCKVKKIGIATGGTNQTKYLWVNVHHPEFVTYTSMVVEGYGFVSFPNTVVENASAPTLTVSADLSGKYQTGDASTYISGGSDCNLQVAGNLGLGVTPSGWHATAFKAIELGSKGNSIFGATGGSGTLVLSANGYYDNSAWRYGSNGVATNFDIGEGYFRWNIAPSGTAGNAISFTQAMTLNANGFLQVSPTSADLLRLGSADIAGHSFVQFSRNGGASGISTLQAYTAGVGEASLALLPSGGRLLLGTATDDGVNIAQFNGTISATTPTAWDSSTKVATTAFVDTSFAKKASPAFTGTPSAPTAAAGTNTTQIATTAFVKTALGSISVTPTTAQVLSATAGAAVGDVGTYAFLHVSTGTISGNTPGSTYPGSSLRYTNNSGDYGGSTPAGTWRLMGIITDGSSSSLGSVWLRIS